MKGSLLSTLRRRLGDGLLPYEGRWLSREQILELQRVQHRRAWVRLVELAFLFSLMTAVGGVFVLLVVAICY